MDNLHNKILLEPEKQTEYVIDKLLETIKVGSFVVDNYTIEIVKPVEKIKVNENVGYQVFVKAWLGNKQVGFGEDGSIEIERFKNFNYSDYLVEDINGNIEIIYKVGSPTTESFSVVKKYREDIVLAFLQDLKHTITIVGKNDSNIIKGKIGNTTTTFNPMRIAGVRSGTGYFATNAGGGNFATWRALSTATYTSTAGLDPDFVYIQMEKTGGSTYGWNVRCWGNFDTSSLPDSDTISGATLSIKPDNSVFGGPTDPIGSTGLGITLFSPSNPRSVVSTDMGNFSDTRFATDINWSSLVSGTYADFTLNASGIANINKTGDSCFFWRLNWDIDNSAPAGSGNTGTGFAFGTTNPQKLVVTHSGGAAQNSNFLMFM